MLDVLEWKDAPAFEVGIPPARPARYEPAGGRPAPWVQMTEAELAAAVAATDAAWRTWEGQNKPTDPAPELELESPDGSRFRIVVDNAGRVSGRKVAP